MTGPAVSVITSAGHCHPDNPDAWVIWARPNDGTEETAETLCAEIYASVIERGPVEIIWRFSSLHVPKPWRRQGWAEHLLRKAVAFVNSNSTGLTPVIYLEALPYEHNDAPAEMPVARLRAFYERSMSPTDSSHSPAIPSAWSGENNKRR